MAAEAVFFAKITVKLLGLQVSTHHLSYLKLKEETLNSPS